MSVRAPCAADSARVHSHLPHTACRSRLAVLAPGTPRRHLCTRVSRGSLQPHFYVTAGTATRSPWPHSNGQERGGSAGYGPLLHDPSPPLPRGSPLRRVSAPVHRLSAEVRRRAAPDPATRGSPGPLGLPGRRPGNAGARTAAGRSCAAPPTDTSSVNCSAAWIWPLGHPIRPQPHAPPSTAPPLSTGKGKAPPPAGLDRCRGRAATAGSVCCTLGLHAGWRTRRGRVGWTVHGLEPFR